MKKINKSLVFTIVLNLILIVLILLLIFNGASVLTIFNVSDAPTVMGDYVTNLIGVLIGGILGVELAVFADRISGYLDDAKAKKHAYKVAKSALLNDFRTRVNSIKTDIIREEMTNYKYVSEYINYHGLIPEVDDSQFLTFEESNNYLFAIEEYLGENSENLNILRDVYEKPHLFRQTIAISMNVFRKELQQVFQEVEDKLKFFEKWDLDHLRKCAPFRENNSLIAYAAAVSQNAASFIEILKEKSEDASYEEVSSREITWFLLSYEAVLTRLSENQGTLYLGLPGDVHHASLKNFESFKEKYMSLLLQDNTEIYYKLGLEASAGKSEEEKSDYRKFLETLLGKIKYAELLEYDYDSITSNDFTRNIRKHTLESSSDDLSVFIRHNTSYDKTEFENEKLEQFFISNTIFYDEEEHTAEDYIRKYFSDSHAIDDKLIEKLKPLESEKTSYGNLAQEVFDLVMMYCWSETILSWSYNIAFTSIKLRYVLLPKIDEVIMKESYVSRDSNNRYAIKFAEVENAFKTLDN